MPARGAMISAVLLWSSLGAEATTTVTTTTTCMPYCQFCQQLCGEGLGGSCVPPKFNRCYHRCVRGKYKMQYAMNMYCKNTMCYGETAPSAQEAVLMKRLENATLEEDAESNVDVDFSTETDEADTSVGYGGCVTDRRVCRRLCGYGLGFRRRAYWKCKFACVHRFAGYVLPLYSLHCSNQVCGLYPVGSAQSLLGVDASAVLATTTTTTTPVPVPVPPCIKTGAFCNMLCVQGFGKSQANSYNQRCVQRKCKVQYAMSFYANNKVCAMTERGEVPSHEEASLLQHLSSQSALGANVPASGPDVSEFVPSGTEGVDFNVTETDPMDRLWGPGSNGCVQVSSVCCKLCGYGLAFTGHSYWKCKATCVNNFAHIRPICRLYVNNQICNVGCSKQRLQPGNGTKVAQ